MCSSGSDDLEVIGLMVAAVDCIVNTPMKGLVDAFLQLIRFYRRIKMQKKHTQKNAGVKLKTYTLKIHLTFLFCVSFHPQNTDLLKLFFPLFFSKLYLSTQHGYFFCCIKIVNNDS